MTETKFRMWLHNRDDELTPYDGIWRDLRILEGEWERKMEFLEQNDIRGMVRYFERLAAERPGDIGVLRDLGEAYMLDGAYLKVLELLRQPQKSHPEFLEFQYLILDALFALRRDGEVAEWELHVPVVRLGPRVLQVCWEFVLSRGVPMPIDQLYAEAMLQGYCAFTLDDLLKTLERDPRFRVLRKCPGDPWPEVESIPGQQWLL